MKFEMLVCGGCRSCEMACSYHHLGEFKPSKSSIRIIDKADGKGKIVELIEKTDDERFACDGCVGLDEPLCVQYCKAKEELTGFIKIYMQDKEKREA